MTASSDADLQLMELTVVTSTNTASGIKERLRRDQVKTGVVQARVPTSTE